MEIPQQFKNPFESVKDIDAKIDNLKKKIKEYEEENSSFIKKYAAELKKHVTLALPAVTCWEEAPDTFYRDGDGKYWYHIFFWLWGKRFCIKVEESKFRVGIETDRAFQVRYRDTIDLTNIGEIVLDLFNQAANYEG